MGGAERSHHQKMPAIIPVTFKEALELTDNRARNLLLGNGFSIGLHQPLAYRSLKQVAVSKDPSVAALLAETDSFEAAMVGRTRAEIDLLRSALLGAIYSKHPEYRALSRHQKNRCGDFLKHFVGVDRPNRGRIFTTNYDLILYWVLVSERARLRCYDAFAGPSDLGEWRVGQMSSSSNPLKSKRSDYSARVFYLHGGLHIIEEYGSVRKLLGEWGASLAIKIGDRLKDGAFPVFVTEGTAQEKKSSIRANGYLKVADKEFRKTCNEAGGVLFTFGHSLGQSDQHLLNRIGEGQIESIFYGAFGGVDGGVDRLNALANELKATRTVIGPELRFYVYDTRHCRVWE